VLLLSSLALLTEAQGNLSYAPPVRLTPAWAARVDCIVSGDQHLLRLNGLIDVPVMRAAEVLATMTG
jgi:hypothetical protein